MKKTTRHSMPKKTLSVLLTVLMVFGYVGLFSGLFGNDLLGTKQTAKAATSASNSLTFVVPEAIYLYPDGLSWKQSVATPFQYYINNSSTGTVTQNTKDTTGKIYYSLSGAGNATISYAFLNTSLSSISGGSVSLSSSTISNGGSVNITAGSSPSLDTSTTGCYIRWTLSFTDPADGVAKKAYAYTYVYKPYTVPVGGFNRVENTDGSSHYAQSMSWIVGMHGYSVNGNYHDDGGYYPKYTTDRGLASFASEGSTAYVGGTAVTGTQAAMSTSDWTGSTTGAARWYTCFTGTGTGTVHFQVTDFNNKGATGWGDTSYNSSRDYNVKTFDYWYKNQDAYNVLSVLHPAPQGVLTVDTSRYTDLQYIPNLSCGLMATDDQGSEWDFWYVSDYSGGSSTYITTGSYDGSDARGNFYGAKNYVIAGQGTNGATDSHDYADEGLKYAGPWPRTLLSTSGSYTYVMHGFFGTEEDSSGTNDWAFNHCFIDLVTTHYNKANLRTAVQNAIRHFPLLGVNGISGSNLTSTYLSTSNNGKWSTFCTAFTDAYKALTQVDGTISDPDTLANNLNNALTAVLVTDAPALSLNTEVNPNITVSHDAKYYSFTPSESGNYIFFSYNTASVDSRIWVYEKNTSAANLIGTQKAYNDDYGHLTNGSKIKDLIGSYNNQSYTNAVTLTAGTTYIVKTNRYFSDAEIQGFSDSTGYTGTWPLKVCKAANITFDATGGNATFTVALPIGHTMRMNQTGLTKANHELIAWSTNGQGAEDKTCMASQTITIPSSDTTYYALWYPTSPTALTLNGDHTATISAPSEIQYYTYTPSETRTYLLYSTSTATALDPFVLIYDDSTYHTQGTYQTYDDDGGNSHHDFVGDANRNFYKEIALEAGTKYLFGVKAYHNTTANSNLPTGSYPFRFEAVYKVEYDANGGSNAPAKQNKYYNRGLTLSSTVPTRTGYTCIGWSTSRSATTATYAAGGSYTANADAKLYAVWKINTSKLTVNPNGGTWDGSTSSQTFTQNYNTTKTIADPTAPSGKHFTGWTLSSDANGSFSNGTYTFGPTKDATDTLTAGYTNHTESGWQTDASQHWKVCTSCGVISTAKANHTPSGWKTDGTNHWKECTVCGYITTAKTAHTPSGWKTDGAQHWKECTVCGYITTSKANHTESSAWSTDANQHWKVCTVCGAITTAKANHSGGTATCVAKAKCSTCQAEYGSVDSNAHNWDAGTVTTAPTCTNKGVKTFHCTYNNQHTKTEEIAVNASAHNWGDWTPLNDEQHQRVCSYNTNHKEQADHTWDNGTVTKQPSCTETGVRTYTCSVCNGTKTETIPVVAHTWTKQTVSSSTLYSAATCVAKARYYYSCAVCNAVENNGAHTFESGEFNAANHASALTKTDAKAATCEAAGNNAYWYCESCGKYFSDAAGTAVTTVAEQTIPAKGHDYTGAIHSLNDGTHNWACKNNCGTYGKVDNGTQVPNGTVGCTFGDWSNNNATTHQHSCSACGYTVTENHTWDDGTETTAPTCTNKGVRTFTCTAVGCGATRTEEIAVNENAHNWGGWTKLNDTQHQRVCSYNEEHKEQENHSWNSGEITTAPGCTTDGVKTYTCSVCSGTKTETLTQTGHNWGAWTPVSDTQHERVCGNNASHTETVDHTFGEWDVKTQPGCTTAGYRDHTCTACGKTVGETIPATGHTAVHHEAVDASCEAAGNIEYWTCSVCGKYFSDAACATEIQQADTVIPAKGHDWDYDHVTYTWTGYSACTAHLTCTRDAAHQSDVAATAISSDVTTVATCVTDGVRTYTATFSDSHLEAQTATENLGKNASNHVNTREVAATTSTCKDHGYTAGVYCDDCKQYISGHQELPLVGHSFTDYHYNNDADCETAGTETASCDYNCGETATRNSADHPATGHDYTGAIHSLNDGTHNWVCKNGCGTFGKVDNGTQVKDGTVTCTFGGWEKVDDTYHKHTCEVCGYTSQFEHTWNTGTIAPVPTCSAPGTKTYTCTSTGCGATRTEEIAVNENAHNWDKGTVTTQPTCTAPGVKTYHCTYNDEHTKTEPVAIDLDAHTWGEATFDWAADGKTCTATRVCANNASHVQTETATVDNGKITSAEKTPATCTVKGWTTYTAVFENTDFGTKTKDVQDIPVIAHTSSEWIIDTPAGCETEGLQHKECTVCHTTLATETIPATGHAYGAWTKVDDTNHQRVCGKNPAHVETAPHNWNDGEVTTPASCTKDGEKTYTCSECGATKTEPVEKLGHDFGQWTVTSGSSCTEPGTETRYCSRCDATETREVAVLGHDWDTVTYTWADNNLSVTATRICKRDASHQETETVTAAGEITKPVSCEEDGELTYTSAAFTNEAFAAQTKKVTVNALGHDWDDGEITTPATCSAEGVKTFTCKHDASHKRTEAVAINADAHDWDDGEITTPATCSAEGVKTFTCKHDPSHKRTEAVEVNPDAHDWDDGEITTPATCSAEGVKTFTCKHDASHKRTEAVAIDADAHAYGTPTYEWAEDNSNVTAMRICGNDASHVETETVSTTSAVTTEPECLTKGKTTYTAVFENEAFETQTKTLEDVNALGHAYVAVVTEPTCEAQGYTTHTCSRCGDSYVDTYTDALGHAWKLDHIDDSTCTETGTEYYVCENDANHTKTETIALKAHETEEVPAVAAKCEEAGHMRYYTCKNCTHLFLDAEGLTETTAEAVVIAATGHEYEGVVTKAPTCSAQGVKTYTCKHDAAHTYTEPVAIDPAAHMMHHEAKVDATCTAEGHEDYWYCEYCGRFYTEEEAVNEIADHNAVIIPMHEHNWGEWTTVDASTCTVKGTERRDCSDCDAFEVRTTDLAAHTTETVNAKEATCGADGYTGDQYCTVCKQIVETGTAIPATGNHTPETIAAVAATCTATGLTEGAKCSVCQQILTAQTVTPALGHDFVLTDSKAATCTADGYADYDCSRCDETKHEVLKALGHNWSAWTVITPATDTENGLERRTCGRCGEVEEREFDFTADGVGARTVKFVNINKMHYLIRVGKDSTYAIYNSSTVQWFTNKPMTFEVIVYSTFNYSDYIVYINGKAVRENADGSYTIPAGEDDVVITVAGAVKDDSAPTGKLSFWELLIRFFKKIIAVFTGKK